MAVLEFPIPTHTQESREGDERLNAGSPRSSILLYSFLMPTKLPAIYPILDVSFLPNSGRREYLHRLGSELTEVGVTLLEYRNKSGALDELLADAEILRAAMPAGKVKLILDDRADLIEQIGFDGVHVDAGDMTPEQARQLLGPDRIIGTLGGSTEFLPGVLAMPVDYLSIGPVFPTRTKQTSTPPIGIEGIRRMREIAGRGPTLVAIGGITLATAREALDAGADIIAIAGAIFREDDPVAAFRSWKNLLG